MILEFVGTTKDLCEVHFDWYYIHVDNYFYERNESQRQVLVKVSYSTKMDIISCLVLNCYYGLICDKNEKQWLS